MAVCNKYEAQCETSRMLCMLSKRPEIHTYINLFGIVTILVEELLNSRYTYMSSVNFDIYLNLMIKADNKVRSAQSTGEQHHADQYDYNNNQKS